MPNKVSNRGATKLKSELGNPNGETSPKPKIRMGRSISGTIWFMSRLGRPAAALKKHLSLFIINLMYIKKMNINVKILFFIIKLLNNKTKVNSENLLLIIVYL